MIETRLGKPRMVGYDVLNPTTTKMFFDFIITLDYYAIWFLLEGNTRVWNI